MWTADVPPAYIERVAEIESGGNPAARSRNSSATGLFQFTTSTWAAIRREHPELNLTPNGRTDPVQARRAMIVFTADNIVFLELRLRRRLTQGDIWLAHFLGKHAAYRVLSAGDAAPLSNVLPPEAVQRNRFLRSLRTVGNLRQWARFKLDRSRL
jgi:hypothetical protein